MSVKSERPFALDRDAEPVQYSFDVLLHHSRGVVLDINRLQVRRDAYPIDPIPAMDVGNLDGIFVRQRPHEVVMNVYFGHVFRISGSRLGKRGSNLPQNLAEHSEPDFGVMCVQIHASYQAAYLGPGRSCVQVSRQFQHFAKEFGQPFEVL